MNDINTHPTDLLPFYVNGTLAGEEREKVIAHIESCESCQNELLLLRTMQEVSKQETPVVANEFAWHRLKRDMKKQQGSVFQRIWKPAAAVAAAVIMTVQLSYIHKLDSELDSYTQAGQHEQAAVVQVKFNPNAREEVMRKALLEINAEIIAGPSAAGIYRIKISHLRDDPAIKDKIKKLKDKKLLILYLNRE